MKFRILITVCFVACLAGCSSEQVSKSLALAADAQITATAALQQANAAIVEAKAGNSPAPVLIDPELKSEVIKLKEALTKENGKIDYDLLGVLGLAGLGGLIRKQTVKK